MRRASEKDFCSSWRPRADEIGRESGDEPGSVRAQYTSTRQRPWERYPRYGPGVRLSHTTMAGMEREGHHWGAAISHPPLADWTGRATSTEGEYQSLVTGAATSTPTPYNSSYWGPWGKEDPSSLGDTNLTERVPGYISPQNISFEEGGVPYFPGWDNLTNCEWNDTLCYTSDSANLTTQPDVVPMDAKYWAIVLTLFPMFTVFGNVLVVLSVYKERALQTVTNYFIVSLAVADIMVAVLVMPLAIYVEVSHLMIIHHRVSVLCLYLMFTNV